MNILRKFHQYLERGFGENGISLIPVPRLEILFFPKLKKKFVAPPKSITNDVYLTPIAENGISLIPVPRLESLFFPKLKKKLMANLKLMTNDVYLTPIEENLH